MALGINNNLSMLNASTRINETQRTLAEHMRNLSSGSQLNSAAQNPAGLVISEKMNAQLIGLSTTISGNERSINMVRTTEANLGQMQNLLLKARELTIDSANTGVNDPAMLKANQQQFDEIVSSLNRIAGSAQFGSQKLLDGSLTVTPYTSGDGGTTKVEVPKTDGSTLGATEAGGLTLQDLVGDNGALASGNPDRIKEALGVIDNAIGQLATQRGQLGAVEADAIGPTTESMRVAYQELQSGEATISDADFAKELSAVTRENIRNNVNMALMAQGKENAQTLLQLLM